jgi:UDP-N-acetylmuramoyl-tripeptide--D-alanyl-D-alanine ligase
VGRIVAEKAELLLAYGPNASRVISGALTGGMAEAKAKAFESRDEIVAAMRRMIKPGDAILVKGSRGMRMELILEQFLKEEI